MPPRKKKRKAKTPKTTQRQSQRQSVVVNIGSKSSPRKSSGRGNLPPPSHAHNLAPTFVTAPQVDYTPLLAMMQHHSRPIVEQAPMPVQNPVTPLSSVSTQTNIDARSAQQLAGEAALRRAGKTAGNLQPLPSVAQDHGRNGFPTLDEPIPEPVLGQQARKTAMDATYFAQQRQARVKPSIPKTSMKERLFMSKEDTPAPEVAVAKPVHQVEQLRMSEKKTALDEAQEAISMMKKANPPPPSSLGATSGETTLGASSRLVSSGQSAEEQDLSGFSAFGTVVPEPKKKTKGRPPGSKNKPKKT